MLGKRRGYGTDNLAPYDLSMAVIGTGLLWVGWFGFNGGSAYGAGARAAFAIVATHFAASAGALTWMGLEWYLRGKPSVLGLISGAVAGLGTVTAASGYILPWHGAVIGVFAGGVCFFASTELKRILGYDDSLDVFGVHGVGGILGTLLTGVFAVASVSVSADTPTGLPGLLEGNPGQLLIDLMASGHRRLVRRGNVRPPEARWPCYAAQGAAFLRDGRPRYHAARRVDPRLGGRNTKSMLRRSPPSSWSFSPRGERNA